jgi:GPI mannosyltransferase 3
VWGSGGYFYLGRNIPFCRCDFPSEDCFRVAARDGRFNRAVYWSNGDDPERDRSTAAAFEAAGFHLAKVRGLASLFVRDSKPPAP